MSWSLAASGKAKDVAPEIERQVSKVSLSDAGETETVRLVGGLVAQSLGTFDQDKIVKVQASGSMGFKDWQAKTGPYQQFAITVEPIHLTV